MLRSSDKWNLEVLKDANPSDFQEVQTAGETHVGQVRGGCKENK